MYKSGRLSPKMIVKQLFKCFHCILPSQPIYGSPRQRTVKDRAAASQPADQSTDPDAKHGGMYAF